VTGTARVNRDAMATSGNVAYAWRMRLPARQRPRNRKPRRHQAEPAWMIGAAAVTDIAIWRSCGSAP
jgi:hypothetical protein